MAGNSSFVSETGDRLGLALAAGDFDSDGRDDLAIGAHHRAIRGLAQAGGVFVQYSNAGGLAGRVQFWEQSTIFPGCNATCESSQNGSPTESGDHFGWALAAGDFNGDGRDDLAIGVPFESVLVNRGGNSFENVLTAGEVDVIYGSASGLSITARAPQQWRRNSIVIAAGDAFGWSLTPWNFDRNETHQRCGATVCIPITDRTADLAIGVPFQNVGGIIDAGAVNVIYGSFSANGLTFANSQVWTNSSANIPGDATAHEHFGLALY